MKNQFPRIAVCSLMFASTLAIPAVAQTQVSKSEAAANKMPAKGDSAKDFTLPAVAGELSGDVELSKVNADAPVVIVVLRGYPGAQCPACTAQVADLVKHAEQFADKGARVLLIYPGAESQLSKRAEEFLHGTKLPKPLTFLLDPGYKFTNAYGLRWDAPSETAYPTTMIVNKSGKISFVKISDSHRGRVSAEDVLAAL